MAHVIVTSLSLLWVLLTIVATLSVFTAIFTPKWLIGTTRVVYAENGTALSFPPSSVGLFNRCTHLHGRHDCAVFAIDGLGTDSIVFPSFWKVALVFFTLGLTVMAFSVMAAIVSCCMQSINRKSIFTVTGSIQAFAGLLYILGLVMYASGWGSPRVLRLCGIEAEPFSIGDCSIGWALYSMVGGICLTFFTACLSVTADKSTSSDKVSQHVEQGDTLVCLL